MRQFQEYQHYSFDLWLTLIKSNPLFKTARTAYFYRYFNEKQKTIEEVAQIFREVDLMGNAINEKTGKNIDAEELYLIVMSRINENPSYVAHIDLAGLLLEMENLLFEHLPLLYADETYDTLAFLKNQPNITMNILSNTGFIKGATLRKVLAKLRIADFFDFQIYSDELRLSKPNPQLFELLIATIAAQRAEILPLSAIIHIGDNPIADKQGAENSGLAAFLINSNQFSISNLIK